MTNGTIQPASRPRRIALVGVESSGKTTLADQLAAALGTYKVPEFWRFYWEAKRHAGDQPVWTTAEFAQVAAEQNRLEDLFAERAKNVLICDTDSFQTSVWHRRYLGFYAPEIDRLCVGRHYDLTLLCGAEVPFVQDGVRDGEDIRPAMAAWLEERLAAVGRPYHLLTGTAGERLREAMLLIGQLGIL